jgi:hypothetical protein
MGKKVRNDPKRDSMLREREDILKQVDEIDSILEGKQTIDESSLKERLFTKYSFSKCVNWLEPFIQQSLFPMQGRLENLSSSLEIEFPWPINTHILEKEDQTKLFDRFKAYTIIKLFIDSSLILFALGKNGPAIIELYSVLERQSIEKIVKLVLLSEKAEVGRRIIERLTLGDLVLILLDCGILDRDDIKYSEKLIKLRNGLAHRNPQKISNVVLSGEEIRDADIEAVIAEVDYIPYAIGSIHILIKILDWEYQIK